MKFSKLRTIILIIIANLHLSINAQYENNEYLNKVKGVSYYYTIIMKLDTISKRYPDLAYKAELAKMRFDFTFKKIKNQLLKEITNKELDSIKIKEITAKSLKKAEEYDIFSNNNSSLFLDNFEYNFIKGNNKDVSKIVSILLQNNKKYYEHPEKEYLDGFTQTINLSNNKKSQGINLLIDIPKSWKLKESKRKYIVISALSKNTECSLYINIENIKDIINPNYKDTNNKDIKNAILNKDYCKNFLKNSGIENIQDFKFLKTKISNYPAMLTSATGNIESGYTKTKIHTNLLIILIENKLLYISFLYTNYNNSLFKDIKKFSLLEKLIVSNIILNQ